MQDANSHFRGLVWFLSMCIGFILLVDCLDTKNTTFPQLFLFDEMGMCVHMSDYVAKERRNALVFDKKHLLDVFRKGCT